MYCRDCGSKLDDGSLFCSECGGRQDPPEQSSGQVVSPAPGPIFAAPPAPVRAAAAAPTSPVTGGGNVFLDKVLGLLFVGLALIGSLLALVSQILPPARISVVSLGSVLTGSMPIILMTVLAATISWRAHGMDWSIAGFSLLPYLFTSLTNSVWLGACLGIAVAFLLGLLNGALIHFLRLPSVLVTITGGILLTGLANLSVQGMTVPISDSNYLNMFSRTPAIVTSLLICAAVWIVILFSRLGKPFEKRENDAKRGISLFFAYGISAVLGALSGVFLSARLMCFSPAASASTDVLLILTWALLLTSNLFDNRFGSLIGAILALILYTILSFVLSVLGIPTYGQSLTFALIAGFFFLPAGIRLAAAAIRKQKAK